MGSKAKKSSPQLASQASSGSLNGLPVGPSAYVAAVEKGTADVGSNNQPQKGLKKLLNKLPKGPKGDSKDQAGNQPKSKAKNKPKKNQPKNQPPEKKPKNQAKSQPNLSKKMSENQLRNQTTSGVNGQIHASEKNHDNYSHQLKPSKSIGTESEMSKKSGIDKIVDGMGNVIEKFKKRQRGSRGGKKRRASMDAIANDYISNVAASGVDHDDAVMDADINTNDDNEDSGFIAFDSDLSDVAESIHTNTFKAFEDEMSMFLSEDEDDDQEDNAVNVSIMTTSTSRTSRKRKFNPEDEDEKASKRINVLSEFPWVVNHDHSQEQEISDWLTLEIKDFVSYMSPSAAEIIARNNAVKRIRGIVKDLWSDADIHVFGSFATDLYLPGSDIDMVVLSKSGSYDTRAHLYKLSSKLKATGIANSLVVVAKARVPIIKFVEKTSNIHIDISFERRNGVEAVQIIRKWTAEYPCIRFFAIIIKHFLARRKMNEVHSGGLGGFSVICLIVSFLKNHPKVSSGAIDPMHNLGVLLIEFFELYGRNFNYDSIALSVRGDMPYLRKDQNPDLDNPRKFMLAIQDPSDETNNLSRGTFNIRGIKKAFSGAFDLLVARCYELEYLSFSDRLGKSILGNVIKFRGPERDFLDSRSEVQSEYELSIENYTSFNGTENDTNDDIIVPSDFEEDESDADVDGNDGEQQDVIGDIYKKQSNSRPNQKLASPPSRPKPNSPKSKPERKSPSTAEHDGDKRATRPAAVEYYNISDSDSDSNAERPNDGTRHTSPTQRGASSKSPITILSDDDASSAEDSRSSSVIDKAQKRDYWLSKGAPTIT
ncbi:non-canonical poly(A) polymerase PAP2 [Sugiyamaella lignohabitans]|uniref:polynucleotide adenylyltransferase n=1 Tax=Sugiyamaella lignohabitans TaxID=796027 RepID=A0A167EZX7_9ASCO|nr:non-canonical poly(A) polymerase PAP2 [Sugiyamaella lignohabitans]ANB14654.1 non-canonical poly(A) polymerase PAP2 [Sugiyamaella lignohabitans]